MADTDLVSFEDASSRLNYRLSEIEQKVLAGAITDASDLARAYGAPAWTAQTVPFGVKAIIYNALRRFMANIDGVLLSRAGDETLQWSDLRARTGTVFFDAEDQARLREAAGTSRRVWSVDSFAYDASRARPDSNMVPVANGGSPFPFGPFPSSRR